MIVWFVVVHLVIVLTGHVLCSEICVLHMLGKALTGVVFNLLGGIPVLRDRSPNTGLVLSNEILRFISATSKGNFDLFRKVDRV